jgi:hypothetical protein
MSLFFLDRLARQKSQLHGSKLKNQLSGSLSGTGLLFHAPNHFNAGSWRSVPDCSRRSQGGFQIRTLPESGNH